MALTNDVWLSVGGLHITETGGDPEKINNTHIIIDNKGEILETYNKTHLFDVNIPGSVALSESSYVTPGCRLSPPVETPLGENSTVILVVMTSLLMQACWGWVSVTTSGSPSSARAW